jgi:restriction system protein
MPAKPVWMIRGEGGILYELFKERSVVAIGWGEIGSLAQLGSRTAIKKRVADTWPEWKEGRVTTSAGQLHRFRSEIKVGDRVVTYDPKTRVYLVGEITGEYIYDPSICGDDPNIRLVKWLGEVDRDRLSVGARNSLGSTLTLFRLSDIAGDEIVRALSGESQRAPDDAVQEIADETDLLANIQSQAIEFIKDRVTKLDWDDVQLLVAGLLRAMGYKTQVSRAGADRGKDIVASPDGFGFEAPRIVVEVKHRNQQIGAQDIRSFLGGRHAQDRGLYVSTGGFTKDARYEADRASIPLQLMDLDLLVQAVLSNYDRVDAETQRVLPLSRVFWPS